MTKPTTPTYDSNFNIHATTLSGINSQIINGGAYHTVTSGSGANQNYVFSTPNVSPPSIRILHLADGTGAPLVTLELDGSVTWHNDIELDDAAEAFTKMMSMSAEIKAGMTKNVKIKIRNQIFDEIIQIANKKGSITSNELTYMFDSVKIMDKLQGD